MTRCRTAFVALLAVMLIVPTLASAQTDRAPIVSAPAIVGVEGVPLMFTVAAADSDGQAITDFSGTGSAVQWDRGMFEPDRPALTSATSRVSRNVSINFLLFPAVKDQSPGRDGPSQRAPML